MKFLRGSIVIWFAVVLIVFISGGTLIAGFSIGSSLGWDAGWNSCLVQVMQMKNSDEYDRLSPEVKAALGRAAEKRKHYSIAGASHTGISVSDPERDGD